MDEAHETEDMALACHVNEYLKRHEHLNFDVLFADKVGKHSYVGVLICGVTLHQPVGDPSVMSRPNELGNQHNERTALDFVLGVASQGLESFADSDEAHFPIVHSAHEHSRLLVEVNCFLNIMFGGDIFFCKEGVNLAF